jgi:hypothetical protein
MALKLVPICPEPAYSIIESAFIRAASANARERT